MAEQMLPWDIENMAQSDQWAHFKAYGERLTKHARLIKELHADMKAIRETIDKIYVMQAAAAPGQGAAQNSPAGTAQTNAKRRSLDAQQKHAPEMTYDEMYTARDKRWANGQKYRSNKELAFAFPKDMNPQDALAAAGREKYWMSKNGAIEWDGEKYAISPQWCERFVE